MQAVSFGYFEGRSSLLKGNRISRSARAGSASLGPFLKSAASFDSLCCCCWPSLASLAAGQQLEQLVLPSWRRVPSNPLCFRQNGRNLGAGRAHGGRGGSGESRAERWCWCWCWCWWHQWWFDGELWPTSSWTSSPSSSPAFKPGSKSAATTFYHTGQ